MPKSILSQEVVQLINDAQRGNYTYFPSPADWCDIWIYFLITDRFNNPSAPPKQQWDSEIGTFQGGTFAGICEQLDYLKAIGVGAIWVSPVLKNPQYDDYAHHGYGVQDFLAIDPRFSSDPERARREPAFVENELREMVDQCHQRGIYVILDVVLNHTGNVFAYEGDRADVPWRDAVYTINWRDADGRSEPDWTVPPQADNVSTDALIWPVELQNNEFFRRRGNAFSRPGDLSEQAGDFYSLKELVTDYVMPHPSYGIAYPVRQILISAHQYLIAKYDIDGLRIDTLKYLEPDFVCTFGAAMREYAQSIGKKNFFTFGEIYDNEEKIAHFIGRNTMAGNDLTGIDATLDFPLFYKLPSVAKGLSAPTEIISLYEHRRHVLQSVISSHGEASRFFVTFLDNHDQNNRFHYVDSDHPHQYDDQLTLGVSCLFTMQGIPCLYYGTEQGLSGRGGKPEAVREALWGKQNAFDQNHPFYQAVRRLSELRATQPALRYGRQYFRPIAGDGVHFGYSSYAPGILAYSRLLSDQEVVIVANTNIHENWSGDVLVDYAIYPTETSYCLLFSNQRLIQGSELTPVTEKPEGTIQISNLDGSTATGAIRVIHVDLKPGEVQIWGKGR